MAVRSRRVSQSSNIWPGFVDALSTLLLVLIFLIVVFVLSEFFLGRALSGRDAALAQLSEEVVALQQLLGLEKQANNELRGDFNQLSAQLRSSTTERDALRERVTVLSADKEALRRLLEEAGISASTQDETVKDIQLQLAAAMAMLEAAQANEQDLSLEAAEARRDFAEQRRISTNARRQVALLNQQIAQLRTQLAAIQNALDIAVADVAERDIQIANLGSRLNIALASKVGELSRYRSEFFGRLREVLAGRSDVSVEGDRFVIQSGVLFDSGSADLGPAGRRQVTDLASLLLDITVEIPEDVDWILRIDGHTDKRPINTPQFQNNWQLSSARAIIVANQLVASGVPPERLAATGFGEFHPLDDQETTEAFRQNRRIELKLTER